MKPRFLLFGGLLCSVSSAQAAVPLPGDFAPVQVVAGLNSPLAVVHSGMAGDPRLFVAEQAGRIEIVRNGAIDATPFLQFSGAGGTAPPLGFSTGGERGLLGLAFAPDFASSGRVYVSYTDGNGDSVLARYVVEAGNADRLDPASAAVVLRVDQDFSNHNGGDLHFGPDGYLYFGLGDGGSGNDPCNRAQTLLSAELDGASSGGSGSDCAADSAFLNLGGRAESRALLGKLLRIDVGQAGSEGERCGLATASVGVTSVGYAIPDDNPYASADGICDEVFASGLRNPWRFSFDRDTGDLWIGDVGQNAFEEIDRLPAGQSGLDFGWRCREGFATTGNACSDAQAAFTPPQLDYGRGIGQSITGGYVYRGPIQPLRGLYFFADFYGAQMVAQPATSGTVPWRVWRDAGAFSAGFGEGEDGSLYYVDLVAGTLSRLHSDLLFRGGFEQP